MKHYFIEVKFAIGFCFLLTLMNCKQQEEKKDTSFTFIEKGSYMVNSHNSRSIYRNAKTNEVMDGYYVVGNIDTKWEEFNLKEGYLDGDYLVFHSNGEIFSHSNYVNGQLHGEEKIYSISGKLTKLKTYSNNELYDKTVSYFETGQVQTEATIEDGNEIESVSYDIIGNIVSQMFIMDGRTIRQKILEGKVFSESISSNYDNFEAVKFYNEDGSLKIYLQMLTEDDNGFLIELDKDGNEINRINMKANPQEAMKYAKYFSGM